MKTYIHEAYEEAGNETKKEYKKYIEALKKITYKQGLPETKLVKDWQNDAKEE